MASVKLVCTTELRGAVGRGQRWSCTDSGSGWPLSPHHQELMGAFLMQEDPFVGKDRVAFLVTYLAGSSGKEPGGCWVAFLWVTH